MKTFKNQIAFLTGAASGIGRSLAIALAKEGCHLYVVDVDQSGLESLKAELAPAGVRIWTARCDLSNPQDIQATVQQALTLTGGIDLLINNAGVAYYGPTHMMTQQQWDWLMSINLLAPIQITQAFLPSLLQRPDPHIVNMCSISGLVAGGRFAAYHTSKFGLIGFTESLRAEYGRRGVGVTAICPGPVLTKLYQSAQSGRTDKAVPSPPRWMCTTPERVAAITLKAIRRDRRQVLITPTAHCLFQLKRFVPGLIDFVNRFSRKGRHRNLAASPANAATLTTSQSHAGDQVAPATTSRKAA
jgi:NAD(P)-dependent dehydrogenase (short-subunit alcohol dehydrogenase family)